MITLRQLRYLEALGRTCHFGRAASECAVTQPALSQQIQALEAHLGLVLVERTRNAVRLTPEGEQVLVHARNVLSEIDAMEGLPAARADLSGDVRLGMIPTIAPYLLPQLLPWLTRKHPQARFDVRESQTARLIEELEDGRLDFIVAALPLEAAGVEVLSLFDDRFLLASNASLPPPGDDLAAYISQHNLLLLEEGHCLRDQVLRHCDVAGVKHGHVYGTSNLSTLVQMVVSGLGVTLVPELCLWQSQLRGDIRLTRFSDPEPFRTLALAWRKASTRSAHFPLVGKMIRGLAAGHLDPALPQAPNA